MDEEKRPIRYFRHINYDPLKPYKRKGLTKYKTRFPKRETYKYMSRYWSVPRGYFRLIQAKLEFGELFDHNFYNVRELTARPMFLDWEEVI